MSLSWGWVTGVETGLVLGPVRGWWVVGPGPSGIGGDGVPCWGRGSSGASSWAGRGQQRGRGERRSYERDTLAYSMFSITNY